MALPLSDFLTVWAFLGVNIAAPGPNVINTIATAMGSGRGAGIASAFGVGLGIGVWCLGMSLGLASILTVLPGLQLALTLCAVGLLCLFATRYLRAAWRGWMAGADSAPQGRRGMGFAESLRQSLLVNALNPKALTSWLAILTFFPVARAGAGDVALLWAGACTLSFAIHTGYALLFSTPTAARAYQRAGWAISAVAGLFFAGVAIKLALGLAT